MHLPSPKVNYYSRFLAIGVINGQAPEHRGFVCEAFSPHPSLSLHAQNVWATYRRGAKEVAGRLQSMMEAARTPEPEEKSIEACLLALLDSGLAPTAPLPAGRLVQLDVPWQEKLGGAGSWRGRVATDHSAVWESRAPSRSRGKQLATDSIDSLAGFLSPPDVLIR
ncbi:hypothetical protein BX600DRAFT_430423 [Xylariales sp. PMI_506]|nr:hypothetical protein BX600DRAFT_430423 [Xylariales sp. PMI_506]